MATLGQEGQTDSLVTKVCVENRVSRATQVIEGSLVTLGNKDKRANRVNQGSRDSRASEGSREVRARMGSQETRVSCCVGLLYSTWVLSKH